MPSIVNQQLRLTDSADVVKAVAWKDESGIPYPLTSGRLVVRKSENEDDLEPPLIDVDADIVGDVARVVILKAAIQAADFESLPAGTIPVWEFIIVRDDGRTLSAIGGDVVWTRGVARP